MISKQHAKIVHTEKGFTLIDLDSTNGVWVNGERVTSASLNDGDAIRLGATQITFHDTAAGISQQVARQTAGVTRPRLVIRRANGSSEDFRLPSETIIGRALISDVRFDNSTVSQKHARVYSSDGNEFFIEDLGSRQGTVVNGVAIPSNSPVKLRAGDRITVGEVELRYEVD
jgi:pSer/pThr/pTyr-binding forkhead associated (FHA) protein